MCGWNSASPSGAVAPGQSLVAYLGEAVVGGGGDLPGGVGGGLQPCRRRKGAAPPNKKKPVSPWETS